MIKAYIIILAGSVALGLILGTVLMTLNKNSDGDTNKSVIDAEAMNASSIVNNEYQDMFKKDDIVIVSSKNYSDAKKISKIDAKKIVVCGMFDDVKALFEAIAQIKDLTCISFYELQFSDTTAQEAFETYVAKIKDVKMFEAICCGITDASFIKELSAATYINLYGNELTKIPECSKDNHVDYLNCGYNQMAEIDNIKNYTNLKMLLLANNRLSNITALKDMNKLKKLDLSHYYRDNGKIASNDNNNKILADRKEYPIMFDEVDILRTYGIKNIPHTYRYI